MLANGRHIKTDNAKKNEVAVLRGTLSRLCMGFPVGGVNVDDAKFKFQDEFKVSDFKLGKKEMVGNQEAQIIEYKVTRKEKKDWAAVTLWLDTKTQLPLKRVFTGQERVFTRGSDEKLTVTETYSKLDVDGRVDAKQFELPK